MKKYYLCQRCGNCCRWPGLVRLQEHEFNLIAEFLKISLHDFIQEYTRLRPDRKGLALKDQEDGACIFLEGNVCRIQAVKPIQCKGFPNAWNFPGWRDLCEAKEMMIEDDRDSSLKEIASEQKREE